MNAQAARLAVLTALAFTAGPAAASCGAAFCLTNTNWNAQGLWTEPGTRLDLRYEFIRQDRPRAGSRRVSVGEVHRHHDEVATDNRNLVASLDHGFDPHWGLSVTVPLVERDHRHIHNHHGTPIPEAWQFTRLGDVRVVGRYQSAPRADDPARLDFAGLHFGIKLPTGRRDVANEDGDVAERTLQPGTGTTDAILGAYVRRVLPLSGWSGFAQATLQQPLAARDGFRPGHQLAADLGLRYEASERVGLMLQLNLLLRARDRGVNAEPEDSGSRVVSLSPGASIAVSRTLHFYAFLNHPIRQHVNGIQLSAERSAVVGMSLHF